MSMGQALVTVRNHLRTNLTLDNAQCGIMIQVGGGLDPPTMAGELYVGVGDGGAQNQAGDNYHILERYFITVSVFRRGGQYPLDQKPQMLQRETTSIKSLEELERLVIKHIHNNWTLVNTYNTDLGAPHATLGDKAILPLFFQGRGPTHIYAQENETASIANAYLRKDLRFGGFDRKQLIESMG